MSASVLHPAAARMLDAPGVYICGSTRMPEVTVVVMSVNGTLIALSPENELRPDGFLDDFVVKSGPHV